MFTNYYEILGVDITATEDQIKKAYRRNAIKFHPDKHADDPYYKEKFIEIGEAYDILSDKDKRALFDNWYYNYLQSLENGTSKQFTENKGQKRKKADSGTHRQKQPHPFFNRLQQDTPQINPSYNFWGEKITEIYEFFKLPVRIGELIAGHSDLLKDFKPTSFDVRLTKATFWAGLGVAIGFAIYFLFQLEDPIYIALWIAAPPIILFWRHIAITGYKRSNYFIGVNGFAQFVFDNSPDNIVLQTEVNFNEITDLYFGETDTFSNRVYQNTSFIYLCLNQNSKKHVFERRGNYNKRNPARSQGDIINFCRATEKYWTIYLLDKLEFDLQQNGHIGFCFYSHKSKDCRPYIKLGHGYITFIKPQGKAFTYGFEDIMKIYLNGNDLVIRHQNFKQNSRFSKSGNEDVIHLVNLCNKQFFFYAIEMLLGYSFS